MGRVVPFRDRYEKYIAKTAPERIGPRYGAAKELAVGRYLQGSTKPVAVREIVRSLLDTLGVPAGQWALYLSFALRVVKYTESFTGETFFKRVEGAKANWLQRGADPAILEKIVEMFKA